MDPQRCWNDLCRAYDERRCEDVERLAGELLEWLDQGGSPPQFVGVVSQETEAWMTRWFCERMLLVARHGFPATAV